VTEVKKVSRELVDDVMAKATADAETDAVDGEGERRATLVDILRKSGVGDVGEIVDSCINYTIAG
jgi:hypothetical protein